MAELLYGSTRGGETGVTASQAVLNGLADDGGLYVPERIPTLDVTMDELAGMTYQETAYAVMKQFLTDYTEEELKYCISHAYDEKFDTEEIAPLAKADGMYFLELFHGKTIAFKDMALSILPYLMTESCKERDRDPDRYIRRYRKGSHGRIRRRSGNKDHRLLSEERSKPRPGASDADPEGRKHICSRNRRKL